MAETSGAKLNKNKQLSDEQTDENETGSKNDPELSLEKLSLGPKKKLLVLGLDGLLVDMVHIHYKAYVSQFQPDVFSQGSLVFKRPFCTEFLDFCFERFDVAVLSSSIGHNTNDILSCITGGNNSKLLFVGPGVQENCLNSGHRCLRTEEGQDRKLLYFKQMIYTVWEKPCFNGKYSASNTLLIDAEPHTGLLNPPNTAIFAQPYWKPNPSDTYLGPDGELRKFLNGLVDAEDVPTYVEEHRIGQPEITPSHPDWDFYSRIVEEVLADGIDFDDSSDEFNGYCSEYSD